MADNNDDYFGQATAVPLMPINVWEPRWSTERLIAKHHENPRAFDRGYRLLAYSDADATFPSFKNCYDRAVGLGEIQRNNWPAFVGVDISGPKRKGTCIVTVKVEGIRRRRIPVDIRYGAWKQNELYENLAQVNALYNPTVIMVENNGIQQHIVDMCQFLKYNFWHKVEPTRTGSEKWDEEVGLPGLEVEFHNRAWIIPGDRIENVPPDQIMVDPWARWAYEFRFHPVGATTDGVMATWFARQGIEKHGYIYEAEEAPRNLKAR